MKRVLPLIIAVIQSPTTNPLPNGNIPAFKGLSAHPLESLRHYLRQPSKLAIAAKYEEAQ